MQPVSRCSCMWSTHSMHWLNLPLHHQSRLDFVNFLVIMAPTILNNYVFEKPVARVIETPWIVVSRKSGHPECSCSNVGSNSRTPFAVFLLWQWTANVYVEVRDTVSLFSSVFFLVSTFLTKLRVQFLSRYNLILLKLPLIPNQLYLL